MMFALGNIAGWKQAVMSRASGTSVPRPADPLMKTGWWWKRDPGLSPWFTLFRIGGGITLAAIFLAAVIVRSHVEFNASPVDPARMHSDGLIGFGGFRLVDAPSSGRTCLPA
jgi:hypothetical protein